MRLLISFFLSLFIYIFLILFFLYFIITSNSNKSKKVKQIYIHHAIKIDNKKQTLKVKKLEIIKPKKNIIKKDLKKENSYKKKKEEKTKKVIEKSKDTFSKGGKNIKFDDIFSNTPDNIPTKKIVHKKQKEMTKKRGDTDITKLVKKQLSKLESNIVINSNSDKESNEYIFNEFEKVWAEINTNDGNFVTLKIDVENGNINLFVIATNLDTILLNDFLNKLKQVDISKIKNFHGTITFNTKLKGK